MMASNQDDYKKLRRKWDHKLKKSGFEDIEDKYGNVKQYNRRTIAFENREKILEFFLALDTFLAHANLTLEHRSILELYSKGTYITDIVNQLDISRTKVKNIIKYYKYKIIKAHFAHE